MKKTLLLLCLLAFSISFAQNSTIWQQTNSNESASKTKQNRSSQPRDFVLFNLNLEAFKSQLVNIPVRGNYTTKSQHVILLPNADGKLERFDVIETPIMERELAEKFPEIKSYAAQGIDDPTAVARFSVTQLGLHSMILSGNSNAVFIDPYTDDRLTYIVYKRSSLEGFANDFKCATENEHPSNEAQRSGNVTMNTNDKRLRTYRLALSCNGEYATIFKGSGTVAQQKANVQAQMAITMTRVNGVYEKDLAITMIFVGTNDQIIYLDAATDPWTSEFNTKTAQTIDSVIGVGNYDIGHNFNTTGGGNAGCIGCVCASTSQSGFHKGRGYTGRSNPTGDAFDIDYVAHEMGHQFGGYHTQSNDECRSGNNTEVETGSGSSIMGYAGICVANVQSNSDAYFAYVNIRDISLNVQSGVSSLCAVLSNFPNNPPVVNAGADYTIPKSTPFILTATGSDPDGNAITYCWEQRDPEAVLPSAQNNASPTSTRTAGPMFRTLTGTASNSRYFPTMTTVLSGATSNTWEVLPSIARTFNFSVTARDNVAGGGQTASDLMVVNVNGTAGPFLVTSPNTNVSWAGASNQTITWDVAGTTTNGIDCAYVDIYMSSNGGTSFPILLASKVPNDGSETVTIPATTGTTNRIMIRGNNNIFFDVSNTNFTTTSAGSTFSLAFSGVEGGQNKSACQGINVSYTLNYATVGGFSGTTTFSATGNPSGSIVSFSPTSTNSNGTITVTISNTQLITPGLYPITITGTSGATVKNVRLYLDLLNRTFTPTTPVAPANLAFAQSQNPTLSWSSNAAATSYDIELATDISFTNNFQTFNSTTNSYNLTGLSPNTNYFWRILPKNNSCQGTFSDIWRFSTGQTGCTTTSSTNVPLAISASGTPTINSTLTIAPVNNVTISDINVSVQITHTWVSDLIITLISPSGTQIQLVNQKCSSSDNITAIFDDSGSTLACSGNPVISGTVKSAQLLSALNGQSSQGVWTLRVADGADGDGGSLVAWGLNICSSSSTEFSCGTITTTWNGSEWSNGKPVNNVAAVINGNFTSSEDLSACSLTVNGNAQVTFLSGHDLTVDGAVTVANTAQLTMENNSNLIQVQNVANTGNITSKRDTSMRRLDYTYWSSPVAGQNLGLFSPMTVANRFYTLDEPSNDFVAVNPATTNFATAKGYIIRAPNDFTTAIAPFTGTFTGNPHNGNKTIAKTILGSGFNLLGNPYPSTINADSFLATNPGTLYFWTHSTLGNQPGTNYAYYNALGGTASTSGGPAPNGTIQVGQGFVLLTASSANAEFTNAMRTGNNQNQFFRNDAHRIWLNLKNESTLLNQILIGYTSGATNGIDIDFDGKLIPEHNHISSLIDGEKFVIQGRAVPFENTDIVPLSFIAENPGNYSISIDQVDGLFLEGQEVFIKDSLTGTTHNLSQSAYDFVSVEGTFNDRFQILYQNVTLGIDSPETGSNLIIYKKQHSIFVNSGNSDVSSVQVFDIRGRLLYERENLASRSVVIANLSVQNQVLLVKVLTSDQKTITRKIMF